MGSRPLPPRLRARPDDPASGPSLLLTGLAIATALLAILFGLALFFRRPAEETPVLTGSSAPKTSYQATLVTAALVPFVTEGGTREQKALVHWKNTGDAPIGAVYADIQAFDADGVLTYKADGQPIFVARGPAQVVGKGVLYTQLVADGHLVTAKLAGPPASVKVKITRAEGYAQPR